jgi:hypothetical protein
MCTLSYGGADDPDCPEVWVHLIFKGRFTVPIVTEPCPS